MAAGGSVDKCRFRWEILQPFVPMRRFDAIFYHGSGTPFLTEWKVTLDPILPHDLNEVAFRFTIQCLQPVGSENVIAVQRTRIEIYLHTLTTSYKAFQMYGYEFRIENQHSFVWEFTVLNSPHAQKVLLEAFLDLDFPNQAVEPPGANERVFRLRDLRELARDLGRIQKSGRYSDLILKSTDSDEEHPVHLFILRARWNNFFTEHPEHSIIDHKVQTGISGSNLTCILDYIYRGKGRGTTDANDVEFCEVIERYRLHHLYKTLSMDFEAQKRRTEQRGTPFWKKYVLDYRTDNPKYHWIPAEDDPEYDFRLNMWIHLTRENPCLSYSLESRSPLRLFVRLHLEMVKSSIDGTGSRIHRPFHLQDFVFEPKEEKKNGGPRNRLAFVGDREVFDDYMDNWRVAPAKRMSEFSFRFVITFGTGDQTTLFGDSSLVYSTQGTNEILNVLSDHMSELMTRQDDHDFRVVCPTGSDNKGKETHRLHKAIFEARLPIFWNVLEDVRQGDEIPDEAQCSLRSEAFRYVRQYIYTGKVDRIPDRLLDEIGQFADNCAFRWLKNRVEEIRRNAGNR